jgi:hypothetical protein
MDKDQHNLTDTAFPNSSRSVTGMAETPVGSEEIFANLCEVTSVATSLLALINVCNDTQNRMQHLRSLL